MSRIYSVFFILYSLVRSQICDEQIQQCFNNDQKQCIVRDCSMTDFKYEQEFKTLRLINVSIQITTTNEIKGNLLTMNDVKIYSKINYVNGLRLFFASISMQNTIVSFKYVGFFIVICENAIFTAYTIDAYSIGIYAKSEVTFTDGQMHASSKNFKNDCICRPNQFTQCTEKQLDNSQFISVLKYSIQEWQLDQLMHDLGITDNLLPDYMLQSNFTFAVVSQQISLFNSMLKGSLIGIYSQSLEICPLSQLNAIGTGYQTGHGFGCGVKDEAVGARLSCGSSGGSYGGWGGFPGAPTEQSFLTCLNLLPGPPYGDFHKPVQPGSSGGGTYGGNGGGVIFIENFERLVLNGSIQADGQSPLDNPLFRWKDVYPDSGSGSGGSVQVHTKTLIGSGLISADGGGIKNLTIQGTGGFGGGGRILINLTHWATDNSSYNSNIIVKANPGWMFQNVFTMNAKVNKNYNSVSYHGTISTTPCMPGYQRNLKQGQLCVKCPSGTYKSVIGYQQCSPCVHQDDAFIYSEDIQTTPICKVQGCENDLLLKKSKYGYECLTIYEELKEKIGGDDGIFTIWILVGLFISSCIVIIVKKRQKRQRARFKKTRSMVWDFDPSTLTVKRDESSAKPEFIVEDLPYHIKRFYFHGENTMEYPWFLAVDSDFVTQSQQRDVLDLDRIENIVRNINNRAKFSVCQRIMLLSLKYVYYSWYFIFLMHFKKRNFRRISKYIVKNKMESFNTNESGIFIKFSCSPDYSLAYIDVLNYSKDALGWTSQTRFPVSLVLTGSGSFLQPLSIHTRDPLVRSLNLGFQHQKLFQNQLYDDDDDSDDNKDEITSFDEFLQKFNSISRQIDFNQSQSNFLKNFIQLIKFIESKNEDVFQNNGIRIDVCIHFLANEFKYPNLKSSIVMLSLKDNRELKKTFREIHHLRNYSDEYEIKYSINFDKMQSPLKNNIYDDQVVLITEMDLNQQIQEYRLYEDDREELNNLKQKMIRRIDSIQRPLLDKRGVHFVDSLQEEVKQMTLSQYVSKGVRHIYRAFSVFMTYFIRFRSRRRLSQKILILVILICFLIQIGFVLVYPYILYVQFRQAEQNPKISQVFIITEIILQIIVFPLSWFFVPIFLGIWLINSVSCNGKYFLLMNYCAIWSTAFELVLGVLEMIQGVAKDEFQTTYTLLNFAKIGMFLNLNILAYLGSLFLNFNDDIEDK